tara:strand:- start:175 stop:468 length:294 start_codon:yes stop_codon:yes gene_type:complete
MNSDYSCYAYKQDDGNHNNYYQTNFIHETNVINTNTRRAGILKDHKILILTNLGGKPYTPPKLSDMKIEPSKDPLGQTIEYNSVKCKTKKYCTMCKK